VITTLEIIAGVLVLLFGANYLSYTVLNKRILRRQRWGLNICCGKTDGGGVNADIFQHADVPNFRLVDDIYHLPFEDKTFDTVLCAHTAEHVDDPQAFAHELERVGHHVTYVMPPLWDLSAVLNVLEHKWIFLTFRKERHRLPRHVRLPLSGLIQRHLGQRLHA